MTRHVVQLGPYPPPEGGISRNMLAIRAGLLASGDRCSVIATSRSSSIAEEPDVYHPASPLGLIKVLATLRYDVLHLHIGGDVTSRVLALALASAIFGRGKSVLTLHSGAYPETPEGQAASPSSLRGFIFRRFSRVIAVNEAIADVFRKYGVPADRLRVIAPHVLSRPDDTVGVPPAYTDFLESHSPVLLAVGGLEKDYDPLFQISAMDDILREFPRAGLLIVGDGSMRTDVERAVLESGHADHIMVAGNVEHAITLHLINDADVVLRTTLFDGDAISVREALFLGTPVIATDTGMRPDGVYLIGAGDRASLLDAIAQGLARGRERTLKTVERSNIEAVIGLYNEI